MKLIQSILLAALLSGCWFSASAVETPTPPQPGTTVTLQEKKQESEKTHLRIPAQSPVYCQIGSDYVTFFCLYEAVGEISVTGADGNLMSTAVAELSTGFTVMLPGGVMSGVTLSVTIGDVTYSATL